MNRISNVDLSLKAVEEAKEMDRLVEMAKKSYKDEIETQLKNSGQLNKQEMDSIHRKSIGKVLSILEKVLKSKLTLSLKARLISTLELDSQFQKYGDDQNSTIQNPAIGIDLGTTYCCVGVYKNGKVEIIPNEVGEFTTPSYVAFDDDTILIGQEAKNQAFQNPAQTVFDAKRLIGRKFSDPLVQSDRELWPFQVIRGSESNVPKIKIKSKEYFPEQISAKLLKYLVEQAEIHLKCKVENAVITVPAYFNDGQRQATKDSGTIAGLNVLKIINEPTAAAITYSYEQKLYTEKKHILIFDLGGGTFDVSLLTTEKGHIKIRGVGGDTHLGGEDFDNELVRYCIEEFEKLYGIDLAHGQNSEDPHEKFNAGKRLRRIRNECEKSKRILSTSQKATIELAAIYNQLDFNFTITRTLFESLNAKHFEKCIQIVHQVLIDAKIDKSQIDDIVLCGGSSRIKNIQERLANYFDVPISTLKKSMNMDAAVATGASLAAYIAMFESTGEDKNMEKSKKELAISYSDVTPLSLGVEIFKNDEMKFSVIIPRNTNIPCSKTSTYGTIKENQKEVSINIYEGENPLAAQNNLLGQFILTDLPENCRKGERIEVMMEVNSEGILHVKASCPKTKAQNQLAIRNHKGRLSADQIEDFRKTNSVNFFFIVVLLVIGERFKILAAGNFVQPRIIGGQNVVPHSYPSIVRVLSPSGTCGGTIIDTEFILTAAHCFNSTETTGCRIEVGGHKLQKCKGKREYQVVKVILHEKFSNDSYYHNDIALLKVAPPIHFTNKVKKVQLPIKGYLPSTTATAVGWGTTKYKGTLANILQEVDLSIVEFGKCQKMIHKIIIPGQLCTFKPSKGTCHGDSGGPLYQTINGQQFFIAIISYGFKCTEAGLPHFRTEVFYYRDWIARHTNIS